MDAAIPGQSSRTAWDVFLEQSSCTPNYWTYYGVKHPYPVKYDEELKKLTDVSLAYYNSKHERHFELVECLHLNFVTGLMDPIPGYDHLSFIAKTVDPPHKLKLFFAEVYSVASKAVYIPRVKSCTPVDPDTPFVTLGCGECSPYGVIYHPIGGYRMGGSRDDPHRHLPSLSPAEESAKKLLSEKYTFKSSNQDLPPDEDKEFRKMVDGYAREVLMRESCAFKLVKVVKAVRFRDFEPRCMEDAVAWVHVLFSAEDIFCDGPPELFFAEVSIDCDWLSTCVRLTESDLELEPEISCKLCREHCPMFHPKGEYYAGIRGGTFVDALDEQRSWGVRVFLEEKQPHVATELGLCINEQ